MVLEKLAFNWMMIYGKLGSAFQNFGEKERDYCWTGQKIGVGEMSLFNFFFFHKNSSLHVKPCEIRWTTRRYNNTGLVAHRYGVAKIREHCLDAIASDFETFAECREFRAMLLTLPPPSGDSTLRTTVPSAPGAELSSDQANLLDDLREKWLEAEAGELDERDESALIFDKRLEMLMVVAEREKSDEKNSGDRDWRLCWCKLGQLFSVFECKLGREKKRVLAICRLYCCQI